MFLHSGCKHFCCQNDGTETEFLHAVRRILDTNDRHRARRSASNFHNGADREQHSRQTFAGLDDKGRTASVLQAKSAHSRPLSTPRELHRTHQPTPAGSWSTMQSKAATSPGRWFVARIGHDHGAILSAGRTYGDLRAPSCRGRRRSVFSHTGVARSSGLEPGSDDDLSGPRSAPESTRSRNVRDRVRHAS